MKKRNFLLLTAATLLLSGCNDITLSHYHYYDPNSQQWDWAFDENGYPTSATVTISCNNEDGKCDEINKVLTASITNEFVEEPNCYEGGVLRYIARATYENVKYTKALDFASNKNDHVFDKYYIENEGHSLECSLCGSLSGPLEPHVFKDDNENFYKCTVCGYEDIDRKSEYERRSKALEINDLITSALENKDTIMPYHEHFIRDIDKKYSELSEEYKPLVENYDEYLLFKNMYESKYSVVFSDMTTMIGSNSKTGSTDLEISVEKNQISEYGSEYGYGFNINVITKSIDNYLNYSVVKPSYLLEDEVEGVFYTHNIPINTKIYFIDEEDSNSILIGGSDNKDLGDGWVERKLNSDRMANLIKDEYNYSHLKCTFVGPEPFDGLDEGEYFMSCLYSITPELPTTGKHYAYKDSTTSAPGNLEFWQYDGRSKIYLTNPNPDMTWDEGENPELSSSNEAYIPLKGTVKIDTINSTNWVSKTYDKQGLNKFTTGVTGSSEPNGLYADFNNYVYSDWTIDKVGVDATYTIDYDDMRKVNTLTLTYYSYNPIAPVDVTMKALDRNNHEVVIFQKSISHCNGPVTETVSFDEINFYRLEVTTKAFVKGGNGRSHFLMKDVSLSYGEVTPVEKGNVAISTTNSSLWSYSAKEATNKIMVGVGSWWDPTGNPEGNGPYVALRAYQWTDWNPTQPGLTATYTSTDKKIVNSLEFKYFINSGTFIAKNFTMKISIIGGGKTTLIDTLNLNTDTVSKDVEISYSKSFGELTFEGLQIVITTNEPTGTSGNSCIFLKEMTAKYVE